MKKPVVMYFINGQRASQEDLNALRDFLDRGKDQLGNCSVYKTEKGNKVVYITTLF